MYACACLSVCLYQSLFVCVFVCLFVCLCICRCYTCRKCWWESVTQLHTLSSLTYLQTPRYSDIQLYTCTQKRWSWPVTHIVFIDLLTDSKVQWHTVIYVYTETLELTSYTHCLHWPTYRLQGTVTYSYIRVHRNAGVDQLHTLSLLAHLLLTARCRLQVLVGNRIFSILHDEIGDFFARHLTSGVMGGGGGVQLAPP